MGYEGFLMIPGANRGGGILLFWQEKSLAKLLAYSTNFIDVVVSLGGMDEWKVTCFYGFPERSRRRHSWDLLCTLFHRSSLPWCCIGDFNDLLSQSEERGRHIHPIHLIIGFRELVDDCGLVDLGMKGHMYTWEKSRGTYQLVEERLDRALTTSNWIRMFNNAEVLNLDVVHSDHSAILLKPAAAAAAAYNQKRFRFENSWTLEPECRNMVRQGWVKGEGADIQSRIDIYGNDLQLWGEKGRLKFKTEIQHCREQLKYFKKMTTAGVDLQRAETKHKLGSLLAQEEAFWKQRAKIFWLQGGDANIKLFHNNTFSRRMKNTIVQLKDEREHICTWGAGLQEHIFTHFQELFKSRGSIDHTIIPLVLKSIDDTQNHILLQPLEQKEIQEAIRSMHPDKSLGPDGVNLGFFQKFWDITGMHVTTACLDFLNNCYLLESMNDTLLY